MADNVTLNAGSGGSVAATDDIGGVHFQRVKLALGADGVNDGDLSLGNPMPVLPLQIQSKSGSISAANSNMYTGAPTANSVIQFDNILVGTTSVIVEYSGSLANTAYVYPQISLDNSRWFNCPSPFCGYIQNQSATLSWSSSGVGSITATATGIYKFATFGFPYFRLSCSIYTSGTGTFAMRTTNESFKELMSPSPISISGIGSSGVSTGFGTHSSSNNLRVVLASNNTATTANVAASATTVTLLASLATRAGARFFNDSSAILYLKFGATASTTSFTVKIAAGGSYELSGPHLYNGVIDGIWDSATGDCRVTSW